jgi:hypothetical protein
MDLTGGELYKNQYHVDIERYARYAPRGQFFAVWGKGPEDFDRRYAILAKRISENPDAVRLCLTAEDAGKRQRKIKWPRF